MRVTLYLTAFFVIWPAISLAQDPTTYTDNEIIFDDFVYLNTDGCHIRENPCDPDGTPGSIFGHNTWITRNNGQKQDRAWYHYLWNGQDDDIPNYDAEITPTPSQNDVVDAGVTLRINTGFDSAEQHPQIASGFVRRTGSWFARVKLDDVGRTTERITQAFWNFSPYGTNIDNSVSTARVNGTEYDHEWNNWFYLIHSGGYTDPSVDQAGRVYDNTGYFNEDPAFETYGGGDPSHGDLPLRGHPWAEPLTCRLNDFAISGNDLVLEPRACIGAFLENLEGDDQWVILSTHYDGGHLEFAVQSVTEGKGVIYMQSETVSSDDEPLYPPSQPTMVLFSIGMAGAGSNGLRPGQDLLLEIPFSMVVDWFYYSSDPDATYWTDVKPHIDLMRLPQSNIRHLHLDPAGSSAWPDLKADVGNPGPTTNPIGVYGTQTAPVAPGTSLNASLISPSDYQISNPNPPDTWTVRPHNKVGGTTRYTVYMVEWQHREKLATGGYTTWTTLEDGGFTYRPISVNQNAVQLCVRAVITDILSLYWENSFPIDYDETNYWQNDVRFRTRQDCRDLDPDPSEQQNSRVNELVPSMFDLHLPNPNPTSELVSVEFDLPLASNVDITAYDALGRLIARPVSRVYQAGFHETTFETDTFPSGVYLLQMEAGSFKKTQSFTVVH